MEEGVRDVEMVKVLVDGEWVWMSVEEDEMEKAEWYDAVEEAEEKGWVSVEMGVVGGMLVARSVWEDLLDACGTEAEALEALREIVRSDA